MDWKFWEKGVDLGIIMVPLFGISSISGLLQFSIELIIFLIIAGAILSTSMKASSISLTILKSLDIEEEVLLADYCDVEDSSWTVTSVKILGGGSRDYGQDRPYFYFQIQSQYISVWWILESNSHSVYPFIPDRSKEEIGFPKKFVLEMRIRK